MFFIIYITQPQIGNGYLPRFWSLHLAGHLEGGICPMLSNLMVCSMESWIYIDHGDSITDASRERGMVVNQNNRNPFEQMGLDSNLGFPW